VADDLTFDLIVRDSQGTPVLQRFGRSAQQAGEDLEDIGDRARLGAMGAKKLDDEIEDLERSLRGLAAAWGAAGSAEERADIGKTLRAQKGKLRQALDVRKLMGEAGSEGAAGFSAAFVTRLGPLMARAPLSPQIAGAIAAGAPFIISAVSGAVTAGVGAAAVGAGLKVAFGDPKVKAAGDELAAQVGSQLARAAQPFVPETLKGIDIIRRELAGVQGDLDGIFGDSSRYVQPLARGLAGIGRAAAPGLREAVRNAEPLIRLAEEHGPKLGRALGDAFERLSENSDALRTDMDAILTTVEAMITATSKAAELSNSDVGRIFSGGWIRELVAGGDDGIQVLKDMQGGFNDTAGAANGLKTVLTDINEVMDEVANANLSLDEAMVTYRQALRDATEIADGHRRVTDDEATALHNLVRKAHDTEEAMRDAGVSSGELATHQQNVRDDFIRAAIAMGHSREEAVKLADKYGLIPENVDTKFKVNKQQAERDIEAINRKANHAARDRMIWYTAAASGALGAIGQRATGGPVKGGEAYIVGEKRAEIFIPDQDGMIIPQVPPRATLTPFGGFGGGAATVAVVAGQGGTGTDRKVAGLILELIRNGAVKLVVRSDGRVAVP
jgi:hypothetical protein